MLYMGFPVPSLAVAGQPAEAYALEVLANVLDGGSSARLSRELVRGKQIAASAGAGYSLTSRIADLFILMGTPATGKTIPQLQTALLDQVERLKKELVSAAELDKIKAQVVASAVYQQDSNFYQAMQLGTYETIGMSWKDSEEYVNRIKAVTPEQIQQVAKKYLVANHLVTAELVPLPMQPGKTPRPAPAGGHHM
jgi:zinc protease